MDQASLAQVENLCHALYLGTSTTERVEAQKQLLTLQSSAEFIPQCQYILDNSTQAYSQLLASTSLEILLTQFWNNFTSEQKMEIRNYTLNFIATNAHTLQDFVAGSLCKLSCRITKLGWFDNLELRNFTEEVKKFLQSTIDHNIMGLRLLKSLVDEMNVPTTGRTLTAHRKTAVSFRDSYLYQVFQIALTTLQQLQQGIIKGATKDQEKRMSSMALSVCNSCLSFDFIGTNPEESAEDVGTVQVPSSWKPIIQDVAIMQLFFEIYKTTEPPTSNIAIQILIQISSIRRTLFTSEKDRERFLQQLLNGLKEIMQTKRGLEHVENYHEFCRLLGRLKANYQLSELVKTTGFIGWLELASDFTVKSLQNWQYSMNSIHYLLAMWGRLVTALPYLRSESVVDSQRQSQALKKCVLGVVESYIRVMLDSVDTVVASDGDIEDPLEDEGSLREQMERLPTLARLQYDTVAPYLKTTLDGYLVQYEQAMQLIGGGQGYSQQVVQQLALLDGRVTWLTHIIGAIVGTETSPDPRTNKSDMIWDGQLSRGLFQLVHLLEFRMLNSQGQSKCDPKLELALLIYFQNFRKQYIVDNSSSYTSSMAPLLSSSPAHPLLSLALSYSGSVAGSGGGTAASDTKDEVATVYEVMDIGDMPKVMNLIINKLCTNIKYWNRSSEILEQTLEVFVEFVSTYNSTKTLLSLESIQFLVHNHVGVHFPFLGYNSDNKYRITFYAALARLVFASAEDSNNSFDKFVEPNLAILVQLGSTENLRENTIRLAIIGILRDLRGIVDAAVNRRTYNLFFDAVFPLAFPLLVRVAETWHDDPIVMTALLKFIQELVSNKGTRIVFEQSSANGILLFREASAIVCAYGSRILSLPVKQDIYVEKYKGIRLMLNTLTSALTGNYVNFGVFALYHDQALQNSMDVSLQMCLQIPQADVIAYLKLSKAYYAFLEVLFRNHLPLLIGLDSAIFIQLMKINLEGLQTSDVTVASFCSTTIDHVATYLFLNQSKDHATVQRLRSHFAVEPGMLHQFMSTLMNCLLFVGQANQWAVTRPILSLMLSAEATFNDYQEQLISTQSTQEKQVKLREEFSKLTTDVQRSVDTLNRDRFTQKLTLFRLNVRQFLTL